MGNVTINYNQTKVEFVFREETETYLPHYDIFINGKLNPKYEIIIEKYVGNHITETEIIFFVDGKQIKRFDVQYLTLNISVEIFKIIDVLNNN